MSNQHNCNIKEDPYARAKECTDALKGVEHPAEYIENILKSRDETWINLCKLHEQHVNLTEKHNALEKAAQNYFYSINTDKEADMLSKLLQLAL